MSSVHHGHFHVCGEHQLTQALTYINKNKQIFKELTVYANKTNELHRNND